MSIASWQQTIGDSSNNNSNSNNDDNLTMGNMATIALQWVIGNRQ